MNNTQNVSKEIVCEYWETPVVDCEDLWLERILYSQNYAFFFFLKDYSLLENENYVLTISGNGHDPFMITEEGLGWKTIGDLLKNKKPSKIKKGKTYKVWNTDFAKKIVGAFLLTEEEYERHEKFQYVIRTNDTWIEFVSFETPRWDCHKNVKFDELVIKYLKKDPYE
jgi:hypothetical protein